MSTHTVLVVADRSHVSGARQDARHAADRVGFQDADAHRVGLVTTELASNLAKHASAGGVILMRARAGTQPEIELLALDQGPGIADIARSLSDGHSTAGSAGTGLGAVRRMADDFDIYSQTGHGTVVLARLRPGRASAGREGSFLVGGVSVAKAGQEICGDAWAASVAQGRVRISLVDGLGHGLQAAEAAGAATRALDLQGPLTALQALTTMHEAVRHTRGAAGAVASIEPRGTVLTFAGIGNVTAAIVSEAAIRHSVSLGGILGHEVRQFREYQYPWTAGAVLVMHSDGLTSHWSLDAYPGISRRHPVLTAAVLYRDFQRGRDDVTVVVGREAA